ncbi:MAG: SDR family NAD(P)-dependent oxidoreductase [Alphaproteobacteria bacterium]
MAAKYANPKSILITGGSSGLGAALAREYAAPDVHLSLTGRDAGRLEVVAKDCTVLGAKVHVEAIDVLERERLADWIAARDAAVPLDLLIANAGISAGTGGDGEDDAQTRRILATNVDGVVNTVMAALPAMRAHRHGQIAIMSSIAAFRGFPSAPAYCASKAAVRVWGESLRGHLAGNGIAVSVICPGYVKTPMTAVNNFPMPLLMDSEKAAQIIRRGLARNKARIAFPWPMHALMRLIAVLPSGLVDPLLRKLPAKD